MRGNDYFITADLTLAIESVNTDYAPPGILSMHQKVAFTRTVEYLDNDEHFKRFALMHHQACLERKWRFSSVISKWQPLLTIVKILGLAPFFFVAPSTPKSQSKHPPPPKLREFEIFFYYCISFFFFYARQQQDWHKSLHYLNEERECLQQLVQTEKWPTHGATAAPTEAGIITHSSPWFKIRTDPIPHRHCGLFSHARTLTESVEKRKQCHFHATFWKQHQIMLEYVYVVVVVVFLGQLVSHFAQNQSEKLPS